MSGCDRTAIGVIIGIVGTLLLSMVARAIPEKKQPAAQVSTNVTYHCDMSGRVIEKQIITEMKDEQYNSHDTEDYTITIIRKIPIKKKRITINTDDGKMIYQYVCDKAYADIKHGDTVRLTPLVQTTVKLTEMED